MPEAFAVRGGPRDRLNAHFHAEAAPLRRQAPEDQVEPPGLADGQRRVLQPADVRLRPRWLPSPDRSVHPLQVRRAESWSDTAIRRLDDFLGRAIVAIERAADVGRSERDTEAREAEQRRIAEMRRLRGE